MEQKINKNTFRLDFFSTYANQGLASAAVGEFIRHLNPTKETVNDIKTAINEAVENAIIHAYHCNETGKISVRALITEDGDLDVRIRDWGNGLPNGWIEGNGFKTMVRLMDKANVKHSYMGTVVTLIKKIKE